MSCTVIELRRVALDALPTITFEFEGTKLSTAFDSIRLDVRLENGVTFSKTAIIDDDDNGIFHFEFLENEIPAGTHKADLVFFDVNDPTIKFTTPDVAPLRIISRSRV